MIRNSLVANLAQSAIVVLLMACLSSAQVLAETLTSPPKVGYNLSPIATEKESLGISERNDKDVPQELQPFERNIAEPKAEFSEPYVIASGDSIVAKFYKNKDISGEYLIRSDGTISVPPLGTIRLAGKTVSQAEIALSAALSALTGRRSFVSVEVSKYRPIYVVGLVEHAGSFAWTPDLSVLQAVSLAGGFPRVRDDVAADAEREEGQLSEAAEMLARALMRRIRLTAEVDRNNKLEPEKGISELVPGPKADEILSSEQRLLARNLSVRASRKENLSRMLSLAEEEVSALSQRLEAVKSGIAIKTEMATKLKSLLTKGNTTMNNVSSAESEVARLESEHGQLLAELAQAKQRLNTSKFDLDRNDAELYQELERLIADSDRDIAKYTMGMQTSKKVLRRYGVIGCPRGVGKSEPLVGFQIVRQKSGSTETLDVNDRARVLPGDTIRVRQLSDKCAG